MFGVGLIEGAIDQGLVVVLGDVRKLDIAMS